MKRVCLLVVALALVSVTGLAQAGDSNLIPNRLSFARVGEWAQYQLPDGYTQRLTVAKRFGEGADALVTILVENIYDGKVVTAQEITELAGEPFASPRVPSTKGVLVSVRNETVPFKGKTVPVSVVGIDKNLGTDEQEVTEYHTNSDVPVFGIFKKIENGETVWKLDDFGQGDGTFRRSPEVDKAMKEAHEARLKAAAEQEKADSLNEIKEKAKEALQKAGISSTTTISETKQKAEEALKKAEVADQSLTEQAKRAADAAGSALGAAAGAVTDTAGKAVDATADATSKAVEAIKGAAGAATDKVGGLIDRAKEAISDTTKAAGKALGDATDKVTDEVKSDVKAVGDALGKKEDDAKAAEQRALEKAVQSIKNM